MAGYICLSDDIPIVVLVLIRTVNIGRFDNEGFPNAFIGQRGSFWQMSEEQAQALMQQMQALEGYLSDVLQREESVMRLIQEAASAIESIKAVGTGSEGETLVPVGMGAYVKARVEPNQKIVLHVGAGTSIEQDKDAAINYVESRMKELEIVMQQLAAQRQEVSHRLEQGQQEMNRLIQSARSSTQ